MAQVLLAALIQSMILDISDIKGQVLEIWTEFGTRERPISFNCWYQYCEKLCFYPVTSSINPSADPCSYFTFSSNRVQKLLPKPPPIVPQLTLGAPRAFMQHSSLPGPQAKSITCMIKPVSNGPEPLFTYNNRNISICIQHVSDALQHGASRSCNINTAGHTWFVLCTLHKVTAAMLAMPSEGS